MADFKHRLVVGISGHGKTYKMMTWARGFLSSAPVAAGDVAVVAYSPTGDTWPTGTIECTDVDDFEAVLGILNRARVKVMAFVDEFVVLQDEMNKKRHPLVMRLGVAGRRYGATLFAASQYPTSIHHRVRWNCSEAYVFRLASIEHAKDLWEQYGRPDVNGMPAWRAMLQLKPREHIILTTGSAEFVSGR